MSTATDERAPGMTLTLHNAPEGTVLAFGSPTYPCHARKRDRRWWVAAGTSSETPVLLHARDVIDVVFVPGPPVRWERTEDGRPDLAGETLADGPARALVASLRAAYRLPPVPESP